MRLIDADALIKSVPDAEPDIFENCQRCKLLDREQVVELIEKHYLIDAVPVVRCKDCKYYNPEKNEYIWDSESCNHPLSDVSDPYEGYVLRVEPDDFCSRGERRTDE